MRILLFRYFVNKTAQQILFAPETSKKELMRKLLEKTYYFDYRGSKLAYTYERSEGDYIFAKIGKKSSIVKHASPEKNFKKEKEEDWPNCMVFINIGENPENGQMIAFEYKRSIFQQPLKQLQEFINKINNKLLQHGLVATINPVTKEYDFWKIVEQNEGNIEELDLFFAAPNLLNIINTLNEDLKNLQEEFGITNTGVSLVNKNANLKIPKNNRLIKEGVEYITKGGGEFKFKIKGGIRSKIISSEQKIKSIELDLDVDLATTDPQTVKDFFNKIFNG